MIIDLSLPIQNNSPEPDSPTINYLNHIQGAKHLINGAIKIVSKKSFIKGMMLKTFNFFREILYFAGLEKKIKINLVSLLYRDFPGEMGLANEDIFLSTHSGTHLDAPWHFGPKAGAIEAITIDKIPLEWCYNDGVILDFRYKNASELITEQDIKDSLDKIKYKIKPLDIILIMTGADKHFDKDDYFFAHPGMTPEATKYILQQGVKIIGIDAWGFDRPATGMLKDFLETRDNSFIFPAHFVGRDIEYCHIEKLANLDKIPKSSGFKVSCFPVKIEKASAGWCRVVAII